MNPKFIIGLINFHSEHLILECLESVARNSRYMASSQIVVVDNSQTFNRSTFRDTWQLEVLEPRANLGFAGGVNEIVRYSRARDQALPVLLLNPDTVFVADVLAGLHSCLEETAADIATCLIEDGDSGRLWFGGGTFSLKSGRTSHIGYGRPVPEPSGDRQYLSTHWASGACVMMSASYAKSCELLDESYFLYLEELEWQIRNSASVMIWNVAALRHFAGTSSGGGYTSKYREQYFCARNRRKLRLTVGAGRLRWGVRWIYDFLIVPLRHGDIRLMALALAGASRANASSESAMALLGRISNSRHFLRR